MQSVEELCCYYIAFIRSVYLQHQSAHWKTRGSNFYGQHLLFERIYKSAAEDADAVAERLIGLFGNEVLDLSMQAQMIGKILNEFTEEDLIKSSLDIETSFLALSEKFYNILDDEGKLTLGNDDLIMSVASNREAAVYLLKQSLPYKDANEKIAARAAILSKLKK